MNRLSLLLLMLLGALWAAWGPAQAAPRGAPATPNWSCTNPLGDCQKTALRNLGVTERGARRLQPGPYTIPTPNGAQDVYLGEGGTIWSLVASEGRTTNATETLQAHVTSLAAKAQKLASELAAEAKAFAEYTVANDKRIAAATARINEQDRDLHRLQNAFEHPRETWRLLHPEIRQGLIALAALFVLLTVVAIVLTVIILALSYRMRELARRMETHPLTLGPTPERLNELIGMYIEFPIDRRCLVSPRQGDHPSFTAYIASGTPRMRSLPQRRGGGRSLEYILYGRGLWDHMVTEDAQDVEIGFVDSQGRLHAQPGALSNQIERALQGDTSARSERIRAWLRARGIEMEPAASWQIATGGTLRPAA